MPSTASLFKDTDHPFRWFLAPYGNIYFISADTLEAYKDAKPAIKKWVETVVGLKRYSVPFCWHTFLQLQLFMKNDCIDILVQTKPIKLTLFHFMFFKGIMAIGVHSDQQ